MVTPTNAYDLSILPTPAETISEFASHGWVFGTPRGIATTQWPLDPLFGGPLMHGFTVLLPPDYRCHGPDIVGFSFFATAFDQNDGGHDPDPAFAAMIRNPLAARDIPNAWKPYQRQAKQLHPRTYRMQDILGYEYAVVLLSEVEIRSTPTAVPNITPLRGGRPAWMENGAAFSYMTSPYEIDAIGTQPKADVNWHRAIKWSPRATDPNIGKKPMEDWGEGPTASGYQNPFNPDNGYALHDWAKSHDQNHIGGTMYPIQGVPEMGIFHMGFLEHFGGYNFGTGNAQLDFQNMRFDWAQ